MKLYKTIFILFILLNFFLIKIYTEDNIIFFHKLNDETLLFDFIKQENKKKCQIPTIKRILNLLKEIEKEYIVNIKTEELMIKDNKNIIIGYIINIDTSKDYFYYFQGPGHRSILIESIIVNLLQPFSDINDSHIEFIILKVNNAFLAELGTDRHYESIYTRKQIKNYDNYYDFNTYPDSMKK